MLGDGYLVGRAQADGLSIVGEQILRYPSTETVMDG
jgi:hypothetical protein